MIDLAFALQDATSVPRQHRRALAAALAQALPWLPTLPGAGVHRLNVSAGGGAQALLSGRTRLTLRLPRERAAAAAALQGQALDLGPVRLRLGAPQLRELLPHGTLYAHLVAAETGADEADFLAAVQAELDALGLACRAICGRHQALDEDGLHGFSLMLDGLSAAGARQLLDSGLGAHRLLGCGLFVPHRSAAAVGTPH